MMDLQRAGSIDAEQPVAAPRIKSKITEQFERDFILCNFIDPIKFF